MEQIIIETIANSGVPTILAIYTLHTINGTLKELTKSITRLEAIIGTTK